MSKGITLTIDKLSKSYGSKLALDNFDITFTEGIYGLLGPNGAGKSTLMNLLTDTIKRTSGNIYFNGEEVNKLKTSYRQRIGYMPQQQGMYDGFSAERYLYYISKLKGVKRNKAIEDIGEYLKLVGLKSEAHRKLGEFSGGMRQRILFAATLLGDPDILILDEPTAGLDPEERIKIRNFISEVSKNKIVILATHVVSDIECIAKELLLLKEGKLIDRGTCEELLKSVEDHVFEKNCQLEEVKHLREKFKYGNISQGKNNITYRIVGDECPDGFNKATSVVNLEDVYLYYFKYSV